MKKVTLTVCVVLSAFMYIVFNQFYSSERLQTIRLTQTFALIALTAVYFTILFTTLAHFANEAFKKRLLIVRSGLALAALYFGLIHSFLAFFSQLGGFGGLGFLGDKYLQAIGISFTALIILTILNIHPLVQKIRQFNPAVLTVLGHVSGILILIHALMLGSHFSDLSGAVAQIMMILIMILLILESIVIDRFLKNRFMTPTVGFTTLVCFSFVLSYFVLYLIPPESPLSLGIHSYHIQLAKEAQQQTSSPGLMGEKNRRFNLKYSPPEKIAPDQKVRLRFEVFDAQNGSKVVTFQKINEKFVHLIVVDETLQYFDHVHPEPDGDGFGIDYSFPKDSNYRLYLDFQPVGVIEQQFALLQPVGEQFSATKQTIALEESSDKSFGEFNISIDYPKPLLAKKLSVGEQKLAFTIKDKSGNPLTNLKPYLGSFGHLVMINTLTFEYIHAHPVAPNLLKPDQNGGPTVEFLPLGLYAPLKPGVYKIFAQFNPDNKLITSDFMVVVK